jgi:hypothetical protein
MEGRDHVENLGLGESTAFIYFKYVGCECGLYRRGSELGPVMCSCEQGNEPSSSIEGGEFLD